MKPGDMIEWVYVWSGEIVNDDRLFSSTMEKYVDITGPALLISIKDNVYMWLNNEGLFHARVNDSKMKWMSKWMLKFVPRVRNTHKQIQR